MRVSGEDVSVESCENSLKEEGGIMMSVGLMFMFLLEMVDRDRELGLLVGLGEVGEFG